MFKPVSGVLALSICMLGINGVWANTLTINSSVDSVAAGDGFCTLREAVDNASTNSDTTSGDCAAGLGADRVVFGLSGTFTLSSPLVFTASEPLMLDGAAQHVTLSGNNAVQLIRVSPSALLTVNNLTLANGFVGGGGFGGSNGGGAIFNNDGNVTILNSTFTANSSAGNGGAIYNVDNSATVGGLMEIFNSTFHGNTAFSGGALANGSTGIMTLVHSTVVSNSSVTPLCPPGQFCSTVISQGGGAANTSLGTLTLINSMVAGNTNVIKSTVSDLVSASDLTGFGLRGNNNLIGTADGIAGGLANGVNGNVIGVDVNTLVSTVLADNGGPTQTLALLPASAALDSASSANCLAADQRGVTRPQGSACDIGAFETAVTADLAVSQSASPNPVLERDAVTWMIEGRNNGSANATNVRLTDTLPVAGLTSISATSSQGVCTVASNVVTCNLGALSNAATASVTVRAVTTVKGTINNNVTIAGDQQDNLPANNTNTLTTAVQALLCNGLKPTKIGTPGNDSITGTKNKDIIHGLGGNDTILGGDSNDVICGGEGQDTLKGQNGSDTIDGGTGIDSCDGGSGTDIGNNCEVKTAIP